MKHLSDSIAESLNERRLGEYWKEENKDGFFAQILCFDNPSEQYGIDGGRISKLHIRKGKRGEVVCNYDRGWDVKPTDDVKDFYNELIKKYN